MADSLSGMLIFCLIFNHDLMKFTFIISFVRIKNSSLHRICLSCLQYHWWKKLLENQYSYPCIHVWALLNIISTLSHWTTESHLVWEKWLPREWFAWTKLHVNDFDIIITTHWIVQQGRQYKKINGDWSALHKSNKL